MMPKTCAYIWMISMGLGVDFDPVIEKRAEK